MFPRFKRNNFPRETISFRHALVLLKQSLDAELDAFICSIGSSLISSQQAKSSVILYSIDTRAEPPFFRGLQFNTQSILLTDCYVMTILVFQRPVIRFPFNFFYRVMLIISMWSFIYGSQIRLQNSTPGQARSVRIILSPKNSQMDFKYALLINYSNSV